jgi:L-threonylcarbamoyladenylate synthase
MVWIDMPFIMDDNECMGMLYAGGFMDTCRYTYEDIDIVAKQLQKGKVIAFPTDTVYGLAVVFDDERALSRLKKAKGRPEDKPIPVMIGDMRQMHAIAYVNERAVRLADAFMPGAITLILPKREHIAEYITNGFSTIGIRMPNDDFILSLIRRCGKPLLVTSANLSGYPSAADAEEVLAQLDGRIDGIVVGEAGGHQASTIIDVSGEDYRILRQGIVEKEAVERVLLGGTL